MIDDLHDCGQFAGVRAPSDQHNTANLNELPWHGFDVDLSHGQGFLGEWLNRLANKLPHRLGGKLLTSDRYVYLRIVDFDGLNRGIFGRFGFAHKNSRLGGPR